MKALKDQHIPQWQLDINAKIQEKRKAAHEKRFEDEKAIVNTRLTDMLGIYFDNYLVDDDEANDATFKVLNDEWEELCQKWKIQFKSLVLDHEALEKAIKLNLEDPKMKEVIEQMRSESGNLGAENSKKLLSETNDSK